MAAKRQLKFTPDVLAYPLLFVLLLWIVFWIEVRFDVNFNYLGVYPQTIEGLRGVLFAPFIHSGIEHLFNNSVPLMVLTMALFYFYRSIRWKVLLYGALLTGILTWVIGRPAIHIGASGVVYMLTAFLFFKGIFSKQFQLIALAFVVVFLYGSFLWYVFPIDPKISWEGHLSGFAVGLVFAIFFKGAPLPKKTYEWEREDYNPDEDPFLRHFDEEGNFIEFPPEDQTATEDMEDKKFRITYTYKRKSTNSDGTLP